MRRVVWSAVQEEASFRLVCYCFLGALHAATCIIKGLFFFPTAVLIAILYFCKVLADEHDFPILYFPELWDISLASINATARISWVLGPFSGALWNRNGLLESRKESLGHFCMFCGVMEKAVVEVLQLAARKETNWIFFCVLRVLLSFLEFSVAYL